MTAATLTNRSSSAPWRWTQQYDDNGVYLPVPHYNVISFGAYGNGIKDDTAAIQVAIDEAMTTGGVVYFPPGIYPISTSLLVQADNVHLMGTGRNSLIKPNASFPNNTQMIWVQGPGGAGNFRQGFAMSDLNLQCTVPTGCTGLQLDSTYYAYVKNCFIEGVYAQNIYLNGIGGAFGAYTTIEDCHLGAVPSGAGSGGFGVLSNNHEFSTIRGGVINWFNIAGGMGVKLQNGNYIIHGVTFDECDTSVWLEFTHNCTIEACQFDRGLSQFIYVHGALFNRVIGNYFGTFAGSGGTPAIIHVNNSGSIRNIFSGNQASNFGTQWTTWLIEDGGVTTPANYYVDNETLGLTVTLQTGIMRNNRGYNPVGQVTAPSFPATTVAATNNTQADVTAYIANGTGAITQIQIAGAGGSYVNTNLQIAASGWGTVRIPAGGSVKFTYSSGAPAWTWFGD